jgi:hypothetical protein
MVSHLVILYSKFYLEQFNAAVAKASKKAFLPAFLTT